MNITRVEDILICIAILLLVSLLLYKHWIKRSVESELKDGLGITELIEGVKSELIRSDENRRSSGLPPLFEVKSFDLELNFLVKSSRKGLAGINYELVAVSGETEVSSERVQKILLHMDAAKPQTGSQPSQSEVEGQREAKTIGDTPPKSASPSPSSRR